MSIETMDVEIEGTQYKVTQLGSKKGRRLLMRLFRIVGPSLMSAMGGKVSLDKLGETDLGELAPAVKDLCDKALEDELENLFEIFSKTTEVYVGDDKWQRLNDIAELHFAGKYKEMFLWIWFCLKVNYEDFFAGSAAFAGAAAQAQVVKLSGSQTA